MAVQEQTVWRGARSLHPVHGGQRPCWFWSGEGSHYPAEIVKMYVRICAFESILTTKKALTLSPLCSQTQHNFNSFYRNFQADISALRE